MRVGLTGNVASGKSAVARVWAEAGVPVVSADELAREAVAPGSDGLAEVVEAFGPEVLAGDGSLDRARLAAVVFGDPGARRRLEEILHPRIARLRDRWEAARAREGADLVVSEVPLLFEAGLEDRFDVVVVVHADEATRRRRLVEDRGMAPEEAERVMSAQGDPGEKLARADHVLRNDGTLDELRDAAGRLLERLRGEAGPHAGGAG